MSSLGFLIASHAFCTGHWGASKLEPSLHTNKKNPKESQLLQTNGQEKVGLTEQNNFGYTLLAPAKTNENNCLSEVSADLRREMNFYPQLNLHNLSKQIPA